MKNLTIVFLLSFSVLADEPATAPVEKTFPEWHAVKKFHSEEGFQLKDTALKSMDVTFQALSGSGPWKVPESAIARVKYSSGVYRLVEGWITFVLVEIVSKSSGFAVIKSADLEPSDSIAISGVSALRLTEADLTSDTVDSCSH